MVLEMNIWVPSRQGVCGLPCKGMSRSGPWEALLLGAEISCRKQFYSALMWGKTGNQS